jgi:hypothetical protein
VKEAVFGSYAEGVLGLMAFIFYFTISFGSSLKKDLMGLVNSFEKRHLNLDRPNYAHDYFNPKRPGGKNSKKVQAF